MRQYYLLRCITRLEPNIELLNHLTKNFYLKSFIKLQLIFTFLDEVNHQNLPVCVCFKYMLMLVKIRSKKGPEISFPNRQILRVSGTLVKVI